MISRYCVCWRGERERGEGGKERGGWRERRVEREEERETEPDRQKQRHGERSSVMA